MCCLMVRVGIAKELSKSLEYLGHCSGLCRMSRVTVDSATVVAITHLELRTFLASGVTTLLAFLTGNFEVIFQDGKSPSGQKASIFCADSLCRGAWSATRVRAHPHS